MNRLRNLSFYPDGLPAVGLLFLRIFAGYALAQHGFEKISNPLHWMDRMQPGVPGFLQALAAISEFFGGLALIFGAFTPLACFGIMCTMFVAALSHIMRGAPMVARGDSWESPGLYFVIALMFFLTGPGLLSFDYFVFGRKRAAIPAA
ncbi:MAG TPA: DoxX family protein [Abditibacterium sp.]